MTFWTGRPRVVRVVRQEGSPASPSMIRPNAAHVLLDRALADLDAELEQLAADALRAPQTVTLGHIACQLYGVGADEQSKPIGQSQTWTAVGPPEHAELVTESGVFDDELASAESDVAASAAQQLFRASPSVVLCTQALSLLSHCR